MPLEAIEMQRFEMLLGEFVDVQFLHDYYGIGDPRANQDLWRALERFRNGHPREAIGFSRYLLEKFFQKNRVLPRKWMAARVGLRLDHFNKILLDLENAKLLPRASYVVFDELIDENLVEDLIGNLPGLRFRTFYDHESFCSRLHESLARELGQAEAEFQNKALWCATDTWLDEHADDGDYPRRFAEHFDCITCEPLSLAHAAWLDFAKPMSLGPDRCSKLTYLRHYEQLSRYHAGVREPEDLDRYRRALEGARV